MSLLYGILLGGCLGLYVGGVWRFRVSGGEAAIQDPGLRVFKGSGMSR